MNEQEKETLIVLVTAASLRWQSAFNAGDAIGCAALYEKEAVMHARPFGKFTGVNEIQKFWQKLIDDGFTDVKYIGPQIEVLDERSAVLTSAWTMNKARGVIHKELWVLQDDGTMKLHEDDFKAE